MRQMATIRRIDGIYSIPDADAIETAQVGGWKVVVKKGEFQPGDLAVYCEIDSWIPHNLAPFLSKGQEPREYNGVKGERLRTVKLRKQLSQGLLLNIATIPVVFTVEEGLDVSEALDIQKWEMPIPAQLTGQVKGNFPTQIPKTDQERVQNLKAAIEGYNSTLFEVTEKLEGSSMTCYLINGAFGVCSRNLDLKEAEGNAFWDTARQENIEETMRKTWSDNVAIQGELIGPGIQGNIYGLTHHQFYVFDIFDINMGLYVDPSTRRAAINTAGLKHVPVLDPNFLLNHDIDQLLQMAEGQSKLNLNQEREGLVFKGEHNDFTFKAISNKYLLKQK